MHLDVLFYTHYRPFNEFIAVSSLPRKLKKIKGAIKRERERERELKKNVQASSTRRNGLYSFSLNVICFGQHVLDHRRLAWGSRGCWFPLRSRVSKVYAWHSELRTKREPRGGLWKALVLVSVHFDRDIVPTWKPDHPVKLPRLCGCNGLRQRPRLFPFLVRSAFIEEKKKITIKYSQKQYAKIFLNEIASYFSKI